MVASIRYKKKTISSTSIRRDNSWLNAKRAVRAWALGALGHVPAAAYEAFGSGGASTRWLRSVKCEKVDGCTGDAIKDLSALTWCEYEWFDVDPWGDPWEAIRIVGQRATAQRIALFVCDGYLPMVGRMRFPWPLSVRNNLGWRDDDDTRKAWVWYHYPAAFREVLACVMPGWVIEDTRTAPLDSRRGTIVRYSAAVLTKRDVSQ